MKIDLKEVREFFEKEEISKIAYEYFNGRHDGFKDIFDLLLTAFEIEKENNIDSLNQLKDINDNIAILYSLLSYGIKDYLRFLGKNYTQYQSIQSCIEFLLQYEGVWNIEYLLKHYGFSKEKLYKLRGEVESEFYPTEREIKEKKLEYKAKREKEQEEVLKKYYEKKPIYNSLDIEKYLSDEAFLPSEKVNEDLIPYPILIKFFKDKELIAIRKESSNIKYKLLNVRKNLDFDEYSIVHIPKGKIDDLLVEAFIRNKVRDMPPSIGTINAGNYKSLSQVKKRFSEDFDIRMIRKIIDLYNVPNYRFNNGLEIIHRDLFDEALKKFYDEKN